MRFRYENVEIYDVRIFIMCYVIKIKNGVVVFIDEIINRFQLQNILVYVNFFVFKENVCFYDVIFMLSVKNFMFKDGFWDFLIEVVYVGVFFKFIKVFFVQKVIIVNEYFFWFEYCYYIFKIQIYYKVYFFFLVLY